MADEDEYDAFMTSDEDANYDDFMMSEEEGTDNIEMEDESDEQCGGVSDAEDYDHQESNDAAVDNMYESAVMFAENQQFEHSRELLKNIQRRTDDLTWKWKVLTQVLKVWALEMHYDREYSDDKMLDDFGELLSFLEEHGSAVGDDLLTRSLEELLDELFPFVGREFLYNTKLSALPYASMKMGKRSSSLSRLMVVLEAGPNKWLESLLQSARFKTLTTSIWCARIQNDTINTEAVDELEADCQSASVAEAAKDPHHASKLNLILQCHIFRFMKAPDSVSLPQLSWFITRLEQLSSTSLAMSQDLGLMLQLNASKAISMITKDSKEDNYGELPLARDVNKLRGHFWECLQHLEECGGSQKDFSSAFEKFILSGFIFCNMILYRTEKTKINPFDLEQIKIAQDSPSVVQLSAIYHNFIDSKLPELYSSIQQLAPVRDLLSGLVDNIYYLARLIKLWTQIAPVYSCISLKDIQSMLQLDSTIPFSRDDLLTVLMRSIMKDTAKVFYKLDLTEDLVFFGDEYKLQLCQFSKESLAKSSLCKNGSDLDWTNNVGIFQEPSRLKNLDTCAFFDKLQRSRDTLHSNAQAGFQPSNMRYGDKYDELAQLAEVSLSNSW